MPEFALNGISEILMLENNFIVNFRAFIEKSPIEFKNLKLIKIEDE